MKTLFLLLQTLFELRQCEPAQPIIFLLEVKLEDFKHIIKQKQQIKASQNSADAAQAADSESAAQSDATGTNNDEESKEGSGGGH